MREGMFHTAESGSASIAMKAWDAAKKDNAPWLSPSFPGRGALDGGSRHAMGAGDFI